MAKAPTVVPCPVCGEPAERQMSAGAGLVFHGTGFYITDYGKDGKKDQKSHVHRDGGAPTDGGGNSGEPATGAAPSEPSGSGASASDRGSTGSASGGEPSASPGKGADAGKKSTSDRDSAAVKKQNDASAGSTDKPASSAAPPKAPK